jgi:hypothetical protein
MITRITRGSLRPNSEARVFEILRAAAGSRDSRPEGMLGMSISRNVGENGVELVAVTIWSDLESMATVMGPNWQEPAWLPGLSDHIVDSRTELLETVVSSFEEVAAEQSG